MNSIQLHPNDNVSVTKTDLRVGQAYFDTKSAKLVTDVPAMHKVSVVNIAKGEAILKYDQPIGIAAEDIPAGTHVHVHNCVMSEFDKDYAFCSNAKPPSELPKRERAIFQGYRREDGRVGTRNYIGILTSVNCSATVARIIAEEGKTLLRDYDNVDGLVAITHSGGCGMKSSGEGYDMLQRVIEGYATHPNFGGVLLVGLGCEVLQLSSLMKASNLKTGASLRLLTIQDCGGTRKAVDKGLGMVKEMLPLINAVEREPCPVSELTVALQCGGSDALSGVTANPALGAAVDLIVQHGGSAVLSETPEVYGAEHLLTQRAQSPEVGRALLERLEWWDEYTSSQGEQLNNNPSPGNKAGGLTTILEKSLGAQAKSGTTPLTGVYRYAERAKANGLVFMDSPGYDPVSVTGQVAFGSNVVCFTTGRGSAFGCKPAPSIKLATNTPMFKRMGDDMDINCGAIFDGGKTVQEVGQEIFELIIETASGAETKSESLGYGDNEFNPWHIGCVY